MPEHIDELSGSAQEAAWTILAKQYPRGARRPRHSHATGQLLFAIKGVMVVETSAASWIIPPQRALWIPPTQYHALSMLSDTDLRTIYFSVPLIEQCKVFARRDNVHVVLATPLIKELIARLFEEVNDDTMKLAALLLLHILSETETLPTEIPMPANDRLKDVVNEILANHAWEAPIADLARVAAMSERTLSRKFQEDTGMSLRSWKQRARICVSLDLLANGMTIKQITHALGFSAPAAYIAAFRSVLGTTPVGLSRDEVHAMSAA